MVDMSGFVAQILASHNSKRNSLASGSLDGFLSAIRMAEMQWDSEMAALAALNVKQCVMRHDACRKTAKFPWSGQNLGSFFYSGTTYQTSFLIGNVIDNWWSEKKDTTQAYLNSYPSNYAGP